MNVIPRELVEYETENGRCPFSEWLDGLKDIAARAIIRKRLNRIRIGNFGNTRSVGEGVFEFKIDFGPGYRVYYGLDGDTFVVLLCGGDKGSQDRDIQKANEYWQDYRR
ncbi:MAG: type II toxin-antitoxin system RelE/ParE family toxin [Deltaproteobacteria bacterium]|nr:type II toxin-antitoxin system RelE/ParE family toxin [Deltaproteobacteria bacterium]